MSDKPAKLIRNMFVNNCTCLAKSKSFHSNSPSLFRSGKIRNAFVDLLKQQEYAMGLCMPNVHQLNTSLVLLSYKVSLGLAVSLNWFRTRSKLSTNTNVKLAVAIIVNFSAIHSSSSNKSNSSVNLFLYR